MPTEVPVLRPGAIQRLSAPEVIIAIVPAVLAWLLIGLAPAVTFELQICRAPVAGAVAAFDQAWAAQTALARMRPGDVALEWALMVTAMMLPTLVPNVGYVWARMFSRDRAAAAGAFVAGYLALWLGAGLVVVPLVFALRATVQSARLDFVAPILCLGLASLWYIGAARQRALRRCHFRPVLPAGGRAARVACGAFGLGHGWRCAATCLPLMVASQSAGAGVVGMAVVMLIIHSERAIHRPDPRSGAILLLGLGAAMSIS